MAPYVRLGLKSFGSLTELRECRSIKDNSHNHTVKTIRTIIFNCGKERKRETKIAKIVKKVDHSSFRSAWLGIFASRNKYQEEINGL